MTGSLDRTVSLWDIENLAYPVASMKRNIVTDGFWFTNWLSHMIAHDESSTARESII